MNIRQENICSENRPRYTRRKRADPEDYSGWKTKPNQKKLHTLDATEFNGGEKTHQLI